MIQIEQIADGKLWIHDGATSIMTIDATDGVVIKSALTIGTDLISPSASELAAINGLTASAAELNYLDIASLGTGAASKAVVLDAGDDYVWPASGVLKYGVLKDPADTAITATGAAINALVQGVAGGYKIARGIRTTGAAQEDVATGLTTVVAAVTCLVGDPGLTHMWTSCTPGDQAGAPAAGSIRIFSWKPTAADNVTPIAATSTFANTAWIAIGT